MRILIVLYACLLLFSSKTQSQNQCYLQIGEYTGIENSNMQIIEEAACILKDSFPVTLRDYFKVYDFTYYIETESMGGLVQYNEFYNLAKTSINTPYYLIFGRKSNPEKLIQELTVEIKFPFEIDSFCCIHEIDIQNYNQYLQAYLMSEYSRVNYEPQLSNIAIQNTILQFAIYVGQKKLCCDCESGFRSNSCDLCLDDKQKAMALEENGYGLVDGEIISLTSLSEDLPYFKCNTKIRIKLPTSEIELNDELKDYAEDISDYLPIIIEVRVVSNANCSELLSLKKNNKNVSRSNENYLIIINYLAVQKENGNYKLYVKVHGNEPKGTTKNIWLLKLKDTPGNLGAVKSKIETELNNFCGRNPSIKVVDGITSAMALEQISRGDKIIVIGNGYSPIFSVLIDVPNICNFVSQTFTGFEINRQINFEKNRVKKSVSVEMADYAGSILKMVGVINYNEFGGAQGYKEQLRTSSDEDLIAFLTIHILSHLASGLHEIDFVTKDEFEHKPDFWLSNGKGLKEYMDWTKDNVPVIPNLFSLFNKNICKLLSDKFHGPTWWYIKKTEYEKLKEELCNEY